MFVISNITKVSVIGYLIIDFRKVIYPQENSQENSGDMVLN